jgi:dipeptidase E
MIVLTSCGIINDDFKNKFYEIISKEELKNKKMLYITTAIDGEFDDDKEWVNEEYQTILDLGIDENKIVEYKIGNDININNFDIIYMMGGNTIYLLDRVRKYNFDKVIKEFINKGKIYIGSSAGSQIIGSTIKLCSIYENNFVNMTDFTALGIVDCEVVPHANKKEELISKTNDKLMLLYDGDGIIIKENYE